MKIARIAAVLLGLSLIFSTVGACLAGATSVSYSAYDDLSHYGFGTGMSGGSAWKVYLPKFDVKLNNASIDRYSNSRLPYPVLVYNDITYFPMTYNDCRFLGLVTDWNNDTRTLSIDKAVENARPGYVGERTVNYNPNSDYAALCDFNIVVNGKTVDNSAEEFPLLTYRDIVYFPLTWRFAVEEFGWSYSFGDNGLEIWSSNYSNPYEIRSDAPSLKATTSSNITNWASVSAVQQFSYLDMGMAYAYFNGDLLQIITPAKEIALEKRHSLLGDVISDEDGNFYIVWGDKNNSNKYTENTVFIAKYDSDGKLVAETGFCGESRMGQDGNTKIPFDAGNCRSAILGDTLMVNYAREMYNGHQSNNVIGVSIKDMTPKKFKSTWEIPYTSHSFNQDIIASKYANDFVYADHGDAYDRAFSVTVGTKKINTFTFYLRPNAAYNMYIVNKTSAQLGGLFETSSGTVLVAASAKDINESAETDPQSLFVQIFDPTAEKVSRDMFIGGETRSGRTSLNINDSSNSPLTSVTDYGVIWVTDNTKYSVIKPHAVVAEDRIVIFWNENGEEGNIAYYTVLSADGKIVRERTSLGEARLNSEEKPIYCNGKISWAASHSGIIEVISYDFEAVSGTLSR